MTTSGMVSFKSIVSFVFFLLLLFFVQLPSFSIDFFFIFRKQFISDKLLVSIHKKNILSSFLKILSLHVGFQGVCYSILAHQSESPTAFSLPLTYLVHHSTGIISQSHLLPFPPTQFLL